MDFVVSKENKPTQPASIKAAVFSGSRVVHWQDVHDFPLAHLEARELHVQHLCDIAKFWKTEEATSANGNANYHDELLGARRGGFFFALGAYRRSADPAQLVASAVSSQARQNDTVLISFVKVHEDYRNNGIAGWLLRKICNRALDHGFNSAILRTSNEAARHLYEKLGFKISSGSSEKLYVMTKGLRELLE